jgi:hypothetical protein
VQLLLEDLGITQRRRVQWGPATCIPLPGYCSLQPGCPPRQRGLRISVSFASPWLTPSRMQARMGLHQDKHRRQCQASTSHYPY